MKILNYAVVIAIIGILFVFGNDMKELRQAQLNLCLLNADEIYWDYVKINMTKKADGSYWGDNWKWEAANDKKKAKEDSCFKQYK